MPTATKTTMANRASKESEQRVLTLFRLMDDESRQAILSSLPDELKTKLQQRIRNEKNRLPSAGKLSQLVDEFHRLFHFAEKIRGPRLKIHQHQNENGTMESDDLDTYQITGNALRDLEEMNLYQLAGALDDEHPRTVAVVLRKLSTQRTAALLEELSPEQRQAVAKQMATNPQMPDIIFERIANSTVTLAATLPAEKREVENPVLRMADVFREIDKSDRKDLLDSIREQDADTATELQRFLYRFDDLIDLDDRQVQQVLAHVDSTTLQDALFEADQEIVDKIMNNLSRRAAATLREELAYQRPLAPEQQKMARESIARAIGEVDEESS